MKTSSILTLSIGLLIAVSTAVAEKSENKTLKNKENHRVPRVALMYVGHGEPATPEDGDIPIVYPDGSEFGPHGVELGVPVISQHTEWAAAYEEIATALSYIFGDINGNGIPHELGVVPHGDVPDFFTWEIFHGMIYSHYAECGGYSPHNDMLREHVNSLKIQVKGAKIDVYLALLDDVPRIPDVLYEIGQGDYDEVVVVPMLVSNSTHTDEITGQIEEYGHLIQGADLLVAEPFFEVPYMRKSLRDSILSMAQHVAAHIPAEVEDHNIGVVLASHGTPYLPPFPEFGWMEGEIYSELIPTEDAFHEEIAKSLPWASKTGRMKYSGPEIESALADFEAEGFTHIVVVPSAFPTPAIHTMYDVATAAMNRPVLPDEGVVEYVRPSGMRIYFTSKGVADFESGRRDYRTGLEFLGRIAVMEALDKSPPVTYESIHCPPDELCVVLDADIPITNELKFMLYETTEGDWPVAYQSIPLPDWIVSLPVPVPDHFPARLRIPLEGTLTALSGKTREGKRLGLAVLSSDNMEADPADPRGFSTLTAVYSSETGLDFGRVELGLPQVVSPCQPGDICVTVNAAAVTGPDLKLMLYKTTDDAWPQNFLTLPTPTAVVTKTVPVPNNFPIDIHIPVEGNLFTFSGAILPAERIGLVVVTGVAANFVVEPTDARGFSAGTLIFDPSLPMDFGHVELFIPQGNPDDLNPYHPHRLTGSLLWEEHVVGPENLVPGAIYLDVYDLDGDGVKDIIMVGEPHFEEPDLPLEVLKLGICYMNADMTVKSTEIIDQWSGSDPLLYSPWGVKVIEHSGAPMIIVGCNIPGLAPLEEGSGLVLSYHWDGGFWVRSIVRHNPDPWVINYNAMIVVASDIDNDGDEDIALSGAFQTSAVGCWMENTGDPGNPWIEHLLPMAPGTDPFIRGTLAYKSADLNGDMYPEIIYNAMFDVPDTNPPRYRGEVWLAINPGPGHWQDPWEMVVIDDSNWAAADMWFHDFDSDGFPDLICNQIFDGTVTRYWNPGGILTNAWTQEVIIDDLASPSDMWLEDMDLDGLVDVCSADHTTHRGFWHKNPGPGEPGPWMPNLVFRNIRLPGDFAMKDMDNDGDSDWVGTSMTRGNAFIMEQVQPPESLVVKISLPNGFSGNMSRLMVTLAESLPVLGPPVAILADITNGDIDENGMPDINNILNETKDLTLAFKDVGRSGNYHVVVALYMEGGGTFQPLPGIDYMSASPKITLGQGQATVDLELMLVPSMGP